MKQLVLSLLMTAAVLTTGRAQTCAGMTLKPGMNFELTTYNAKEKPNGKITYQIKNVSREGNSTIVDITTQFQDEKGKAQPPSDIRYTCTGDEIMADLSGMMASMQNTAFKDAQMKMKLNRLVYPGKFNVGQKLPDGAMEAEFFTNGTRMMEMNMTMSNRQVEGQQSITTPAGTFDTYKITSDMGFENRTMGIPIRGSMRVVSYRSGNLLFDVKSETYNKNGKLMGYTLLSQVN
ncbi:TapB family protein [Fibrisoma limi]|nr:hypothetical protein [Fibrisoma limi]